MVRNDLLIDNYNILIEPLKGKKVLEEMTVIKDLLKR